MPNVKMPDGTLVAFPDDMSREEIRGLIAKKFPDAVAQTPPTEAAMPSQGADPAPQKPGRVRSGARTAMQGLTWGAGDEIQAGMAALPIYALKNLFTDDKVTLGQAYDFGLDRSREELEQARDAYPVQSFATEVAGAIPTGGTTFKTAGRVAPKTMGALSNFARTNPVKTGAALGFGGGATYGFAEGEGGAGGRTENALRSGAFAIPFGAGGGYIASKFGSRGSGVVGDRVSDEIFKKMGVQDVAQQVRHPVTKQTYSEALEQMRSMPKTVDTIDLKSPERVAKHTEILEELVSRRAPEGGYAANKQAELILGAPGSGKSSVIANQLKDELKALQIDSDDIKELLPEYQGGIGANAVHDESKRVLEQMLSEATEEGANIVHPIVGHDTEKVRKLIDNLQNKGYNVNVRLVDIPENESMKRVLERFGSKGRAIPPEYVQKVGRKPLETFEQLQKEGKGNVFTQFDNNVAFGTKPLVRQSTDPKYVADAGQNLAGAGSRPGLQVSGQRLRSAVTDRLGRGNTSQKSALARLTPEQRERSRVLEAAGVPADKQTAGMISREPRQWQFEQNTKGIAGVGDDIQNRYVQANQMIKEKLNQVKNVTGGRATTPYEAGESVTGAITKKNREMQEDIGKLYGRIREEVGDDVGLRPERILEALDVAGDNAYADNIVNSLTRKMKRYGVLDKSGNAVEEANLSVKNAEELRKFANSLRGDRQTENIVTDLINALDDDVIETAGGDAFKEARDVARDRFREFETKILKNITDERLVSDDVLRRTVYGGKVKDLQALKQSLLSGTEEQTARGAQAWNDLKLQTIQSMLDKAEGSGGKVSGTQFKRQLERIGKERLDTVFDPQELLQLRTIEKALEYTTIEVPESVVNYSGTAAANANNVLGGIVKQTSTMGNILERTGEGLSRVPLIGQTPFVASGIKNAGETMNKAATRRAVKQSVNPARALKKLADPGVVGKTSTSSGILGERMGDNYE